MPVRAPRPESPPPVSLHDRALENVAFVRGVMERSSHFTAVPGWGGVAMGATAIGAAVLASTQATEKQWFGIWVADAALSAVIGVVAIVIKARTNSVPLGVGPARRFALCMLPALVAGAALTLACAQSEAWSLMPVVWLLLYGVGVCAAGAVSSPPVVSLLGLALVAGGTAAAFSPVSWGNWYLAALFGVGHIVAGIVIIRHHGG
jgi:hypothetical protein